MQTAPLPSSLPQLQPSAMNLLTSSAHDYFLPGENGGDSQGSGQIWPAVLPGHGSDNQGVAAGGLTTAEQREVQQSLLEMLAGRHIPPTDQNAVPNLNTKPLTCATAAAATGPAACGEPLSESSLLPNMQATQNSQLLALIERMQGSVSGAFFS